MRKTLPLLIALCGAFLLTQRPCPAADFALKFEGFPERIVGRPGEVVTFSGFATLTTSNNDSPDGATGWSIAVHAEGGAIQGIVPRFAQRCLHRRIDIWVLSELFRGEPRAACRDALDCDGNGRREVTDGIYGLTHQFLGGPPPPAPYPGCGRDAGTTLESCPEAPSTCPR